MASAPFAVKGASELSSIPVGNAHLAEPSTLIAKRWWLAPT